ncbi:hypothetical protein SH661x_004184 [Planctomicrobium sp. SH661]|uniref:hypothetical protein n=1 Tax=Planctomicrobium sp. SH661 TaxID=3448124 RepID=UPI003F5C8D65
MSLSSEAIDRIVANVLSQLSPATPAATPRPQPSATPAKPTGGQISFTGSVITADVLEQAAERSIVTVHPKAIITPAAWDTVKLRQLQLQRGVASGSKSQSVGDATGVTPAETGIQPLLIVVRNTKPVEQLWEGLAGRWKKELLGCPDDAAKLAISEISRGGAQAVVILAEQTHRAACLANRHEKVKAVAVRDVSDVKAVRKELRANVWCIDSGSRSYFELKNLIQQIQNEPKK